VPELHGRVSQFERFMGYDAFADRARRYGVGKE
jgi:hypothetical protein